ncbi:MAG: hypothetical protein HQM10_18615 [Candidatus Riflebacteria bacterium]|nr:hypothetical protein [Candidatus Riflebacteria bacterium]
MSDVNFFSKKESFLIFIFSVMILLSFEPFNKVFGESSQPGTQLKSPNAPPSIESELNPQKPTPVAAKPDASEAPVSVAASESPKSTQKQDDSSLSLPKPTQNIKESSQAQKASDDAPAKGKKQKKEKNTAKPSEKPSEKISETKAQQEFVAAEPEVSEKAAPEAPEKVKAEPLQSNDTAKADETKKEKKEKKSKKQKKNKRKTNVHKDLYLPEEFNWFNATMTMVLDKKGDCRIVTSVKVADEKIADYSPKVENSPKIENPLKDSDSYLPPGKGLFEEAMKKMARLRTKRLYEAQRMGVNLPSQTGSYTGLPCRSLERLIETVSYLKERDPEQPLYSETSEVKSE